MIRQSYSWAYVWRKPWFEKTYAAQCSLKHCLQQPGHGGNLNIHGQESMKRKWCIYTTEYHTGTAEDWSLSHVRLFATLWTVACQAPLPMGFSRQEYWSGLPCSPPGDPPHPGNEPTSLVPPALPGGLYSMTQSLVD